MESLEEDASDAAHRSVNATPEQGVAWLDTGPFLDGQLTWRMLLTEHELLRKLDRAIDAGETTPDLEPYLPRTAFCSRAVFEAKGWRGASPTGRRAAAPPTGESAWLARPGNG